MNGLTFARTQIEQLFFARPLPAVAMIAIFAVVVALSLYVYRRSYGLKPWLRVLLGSARLVLLVLIVAALFEPMAVLRETRTLERGLPVLIDVSESMSVKDPRKHREHLVEAAYALNLLPNSDDDIAINLDTRQREAIANASRLDLATGLLTHAARPAFEALGNRTDVSYHTFGRQTQLISDDATLAQATAAGLSPVEHETSIARALESAGRTGGVAPAAVVLISDGVDSGSALRTESVLKDLGARDIPVYTVPVGLAEPDDVAIRNIVMQEVAYSGDRVPVRIQLQSRGYEKRTVRLSVRLNGRRISSRTIRLDGGLQFEDIDFRVDLYEKGAAQIAVEIQPFEDEASAENNRVERSIRVVNEKVNKKRKSPGKAPSDFDSSGPGSGGDGQLATPPGTAVQPQHGDDLVDVARLAEALFQ
ncbi:MAG: hypothetical protein R3336_05770, partial [Phycisphaeraceae bacterium]|nr:hypothetical protein [Phycisphaeraceae bacterium]